MLKVAIFIGAHGGDVEARTEDRDGSAGVQARPGHKTWEARTGIAGIPMPSWEEIIEMKQQQKPPMTASKPLG